MWMMRKGMGGGGYERGGIIDNMLVPGSVGCLHVISGIAASRAQINIMYLSSDTLAQKLSAM